MCSLFGAIKIKQNLPFFFVLKGVFKYLVGPNFAFHSLKIYINKRTNINM